MLDLGATSLYIKDFYYLVTALFIMNDKTNIHIKKALAIFSELFILTIIKNLYSDIKKGSVYNETALALWDAQCNWIRYLA